jgi:hypothetical protein
MTPKKLHLNPENIPLPPLTRGKEQYKSETVIVIEIVAMK